ncbi:MAG: hypothetical protein WC878_07255 [Candidatus Paceibacterota bacterium]|jgi:hypothetical protein
MSGIPYLTQERYDALYQQFLQDEAADLGSSEIVLGESHYQSSVKTVFEHILLIHLKAHCAGIIGKASDSKEGEDLPEYAYCEPCASKTPAEKKTFSSANELLQQAIAKYPWNKIDFEISSRFAQVTYANHFLLNINDLLGFTDD